VDWNETPHSASLQVVCIPGLNDAASKVQAVFRSEVFSCGKYLGARLYRVTDRPFAGGRPARGHDSSRFEWLASRFGTPGQLVFPVRELRMLQRTEPFDMAAIRAVQDWLYHHPEDAASEISVSGLGKYDGPLAEVIGLIGPPVATPCIPHLWACCWI